MLEARLGDSPVRGFIADLEADVALDLIRRVVAARHAGEPSQSHGGGGGVRIVAFGPHVATDRLEAARAAGADHVMPRGAFDRQLPEILRSLGGGATGPQPSQRS